MLRNISRILLLSALGVIAWGCGGPTDEAPAAGAKASANTLEKFASAADFDGWLADALANAPAQPPVMFEAAAATTRGVESITNNQVSGVDEGDIVKAHGDTLVVLRRGRLFTTKLGATPSAVDAIDVFPAGNPGSWYDEMLIHGDKVIVIGYRYLDGGATEIGVFKISSSGKLTYEDTYFVRSDDYYSSRNYASRLVGNQLVFYMPYRLVRWGFGADNSAASMPGIWRHQQGQTPSWKQIISKSTIYRPVQAFDIPVLHTVVKCDLDAPQLKCNAKGVIGPFSRSFFVSQDAVYLWVSKGASSFVGFGSSNNQVADAVVYRMPIGSGAPGAVRVKGSPTDQFSFNQSSDGYLDVLVRAYGTGGDWMFLPEFSSGNVLLASIPLGAFDSTLTAFNSTYYTKLTQPQSDGGYASFQNRFIGDFVVYGLGGLYVPGQSDKKAYVFNPLDGGDAQAIDVGHGVDRIEVMGERAMVIGTSSIPTGEPAANEWSPAPSATSLHFSAIELDSWGSSVDATFVKTNATQGETRSHGFFYKPLTGDQGVIGLPIRDRNGQGWNSLVDDSGSVLFVGVDGNTMFNLGELAGDPNTAVNDACQVSCVDWYGNARPIFYQGRIFGLLGYELVEGNLGGLAGGKLDASYSYIDKKSVTLLSDALAL